MRIKLDENALAPVRAHKTDAGLDLKSPVTTYVAPNSSRTIDTGVHVQLPPGTAGIIVSKSGLNVRNGITSTGLIDEGYTGSIVVKLYNNSPVGYTIQRGDKVSQLVIVPVKYEEIELVENLTESERGNGGFGSTGR